MMTEQKAREILQNVMLGCQRVRARMFERGWIEEDIEREYSWLGGEKNILIGLEKMLARKKVDPTALYHVMWVVEKLPPIQIWCDLHGIELPEADWNWLKGFEERGTKMILTKRCVVYGVQINSNRNPSKIEGTKVYFGSNFSDRENFVDVSLPERPEVIGWAYLQYSGEYDETKPALEDFHQRPSLLERYPW